MKNVELKDLVGEHVLTGVDTYNKQIKASYGEYFEDSQCISFVLDGKTYTAIESPDDGYRSSMREIQESDYEVKNMFPPVSVLAKMKENTEYEVNDTLQILDSKNGKVVLEVGTDDTEDYYPYFVATFTPENMSINDKES